MSCFVGKPEAILVLRTVTRVKSDGRWPFYYGCVLGMNTPCVYVIICSNVCECVMYTLSAVQTLKIM